MGKLTLILGAARSGKSTYAVELAKKSNGRVAFIATAAAGDEEMEKRIALHKLRRPKAWGLIEEPEDIDLALAKLGSKCELALIDCLGLLISNLLMKELEDKEIENRVKKITKGIKEANFRIILVSNEVGSGIVPDNPLARRFRDLVGSSNQMFAASADEVIMMYSGIPLKIKTAGRQGD